MYNCKVYRWKLVEVKHDKIEHISGGNKSLKKRFYLLWCPCEKGPRVYI